MKIQSKQVMDDQDFYNNFKITDVDDSSDPKYYGYLNKEGGWIIMKETTSAGTFRYISGESDYATNWTGRAGLSYDYFNLGV